MEILERRLNLDATGAVEDCPVTEGEIEANVRSETVEAVAYKLDQRHDLERVNDTYYDDTIGRQEKWVRGELAWFYIEPAGEVFQWNGAVETSQQVGTLNESYYNDPTLLHEATKPPEPDEPADSFHIHHGVRFVEFTDINLGNRSVFVNPTMIGLIEPIKGPTPDLAATVIHVSGIDPVWVQEDIGVVLDRLSSDWRVENQ